MIDLTLSLNGSFISLSSNFNDVTIYKDWFVQQWVHGENLDKNPITSCAYNEKVKDEVTRFVVKWCEMVQSTLYTCHGYKTICIILECYDKTKEPIQNKLSALFTRMDIETLNK